MFTNKDLITVFHKNEDGTYTRYSVGPVFATATKKLQIFKGSVIGSYSVMVIYIPKANIKDLKVNINDVLVADDIAFEFNNESEATISKSFKELKAMIKDKYVTVKETAENFYGSEQMQHLYIEVGA